MPMTEEQKKTVLEHLKPLLPKACPMCSRPQKRWGIREQLVIIADADPAEEKRSDFRFVVVTCNDCHFSAFYPLQRIMGLPDDDSWMR